MPTQAGQLDGFTEPQPFTLAAARAAPVAPGVHVVFRDDTAVYVGSTSKLRDRLLKHLHNGRDSSVLREQVGSELDRPDHSATDAEMSHWLSGCNIRWRQATDPQELKAQLVTSLQPRFNRQTERPTTGVWWVNQGRTFEEERDAGIVFAGSDGPQFGHHLNVGRMHPGDVVLHYRRGAVVALGEVVTEVVTARRPYGPLAERDQGLLTRVEYFPLGSPISLTSLPKPAGTEGPFDSVGGVKQGYLFALDVGFADRVREQHAERWPAGSPWSDGHRKFWVFQANPKQWDLIENLPSMPPGHVEDCLVTRHRTEMKAGDGVVLWQSGLEAGVYALGRLAGSPRVAPPLEFRPVPAGTQEYRAGVFIERHVLPPITRAEVQAHPVLSELDVLARPWGGTNSASTLEQWRAIRTLAPLDVASAVQVRDLKGQTLPELEALVRQFRNEVGYPIDGNPERNQQREELSAALTRDGLAEPNIPLLRRLAGPAYGSPGSQPGFNRLLQTDVGISQVAETLRFLLYGGGDLIDRLDTCIRGERKLPAVGEAMMVKALAVVDPRRWIPCYVTSGPNGKMAIADLLGLEKPDGQTPGARAVASNDAIRELLEPYLADDPWGMQEFNWWLLHREHMPEASLTGLADELYLSQDFLARIIRLLDDKRQVVFYGPPGTGKTFVARKLAEYLARGGGTVEKVQFHPSYAYEDFVEGYRPKLVGGRVTYAVVDGPLKRIAVAAQKRPELIHVLLIDELNRANVAKVLGELLGNVNGWVPHSG
ncbi:hypothetical protein ABIB25_005913 [Nakamurella sp. UYEF19]|uniref:AAA family ATPase n=1 Tax=Nakamurella sp. UYEF19 TaxID=1756392 RepID=UPI003396F7D6